MSLFTLTSIEQIPYLPSDFNDFLLNLNEITESLQLTFCEPLSFQYAQLMPSDLRETNLELANRFQHNLNLSKLMHQLICDSDNMSIHSYYPSIFKLKMVWIYQA